MQNCTLSACTGTKAGRLWQACHVAWDTCSSHHGSQEGVLPALMVVPFSNHYDLFLEPKGSRQACWVHSL